MIKSPLDLMLSATKSLMVTAPTSSVKEEYEFAYVMYLACTDLVRQYFIIQMLLVGKPIIKRHYIIKAG